MGVLNAANLSLIQALTRPGRLDRLLYVPLPDCDTRKEIFKLRLEHVNTNADVVIDELVDMTDMYSGAEVCVDRIY